jgi:diguanylate cyclase (GGDEF)-like protein
MKPNRLRRRYLMAAVLPSVMLALMLSYLWLTWSQRSLETALQQRLEALSGQLAGAAEFHLFTGDAQALHTLTGNTLQRDPDLVEVSILDGKKQPMASSALPGRPALATPPPLWPERDSARVSRLIKSISRSPLVLDDPFSSATATTEAAHPEMLLGFVVLDVSLENLYAERDRQLLIGLAAILLALGVAVGLALYLASAATRPIQRIIRVVERLGSGDLQSRLEPDPDGVLFQLEVNINRMAERIAISQEDLQVRIDAATDELLSQKQLAEFQARVDPLTGLRNRRAFMERLELELHRAERYGTRLCLIMMDLDYFKRINDIHGHAAGDQVLVGVARELHKSIREVDFVARLGGEEFIILMPETDLEEARLAAERMRQWVAALRIPWPSGMLACTASFGVAEYSGADMDAMSVLILADQAMYQAKSAGRNRVNLAILKQEAA